MSTAANGLMGCRTHEQSLLHRMKCGMLCVWIGQLLYAVLPPIAGGAYFVTRL